MLRAQCFLGDAPGDDELRGRVKRHPVMIRLTSVTARWSEQADAALARGNVDVAARCEEYAALMAHWLGSLEDALCDILRDRPGDLGSEIDVDFLLEASSSGQACPIGARLIAGEDLSRPIRS